jgi:hypothetical protein
MDALSIFFVTNYPLWILLIDNAYMFIYRIFTYGYPLWSLLIGNVYKLAYRIFTCIDYFGCFISSFGLIFIAFLIRKIEGHKNKVTKCNKNQSKGESKAPKIINTKNLI